MDKGRIGESPGFTLIEIIVVVLIIGMIALILLPRMTGLSSGSSGQVIRHLTGTIQTLRDEAEFNQKILRLNFNISEQRYDASIQGEGGDFIPFHSDTVGKSEIGGNLVLKDVETLRQGKVSEGTACLFFFPLGRVEKGYLHFEEAGRPMTLQILSLSGKTKWLEGYVEDR